MLDSGWAGLKNTPLHAAKGGALGLVLALSAVGCHEPREGANARRAPPSLAPSPPPQVAPAPPTPQSAPAVDDLEGALAKSVAACFVGDTFDRSCGAWQTLSDNVRARADNAQWRLRLQGVLDADGKRSRLALELLTGGALALHPEEHGAVRPRLWAVAEAAARPAETRALAVRALGKVLDDAGVPRLFELLKDGEPEVRAAVAYLLGEPVAALEARRKAVVAALLAVLHGPATGDEVRGAIRSLGALQVEAAATGLLARLDDAQVGTNAALALAGLQDARAWPAVISRLEAAAANGAQAPPFIVAVGKMAGHPQFDRTRAVAALSAIEDAMTHGANRPSHGPSIRDLARSTRERLTEGPSSPATAPTTAPGRHQVQPPQR